MSGSLHATPIAQRPKGSSIVNFCRASACALLFTVCCLCVQGSQWLMLPFRFLNPTWWDDGIRFTKHAFAITLIGISQLFAPVDFVVSTEGEYFNQDGVIEQDRLGRVIRINLPPKVVLVANHQVYLDWWYLWCLTYWTGGHKDIIIVLKKSHRLQYIPIIGWGMILFRFIFLAGSWLSDSVSFITQLGSIGELSQRRNKPLTFLFFPEGTLVDSRTRPKSKKWAEKQGIADMKHALLPRATGLHYTLRALTPRIPDLHILDATVAYEGVPRDGFGQSYYTLRSVFLGGVPPPRIYIHLRLYHVKAEVPIGDVDAYGEKAPPQSHKENEISHEEASRFENWLFNMWREKDDLLGSWLDHGRFILEKKVVVPGPSFTLPLKLRRNVEFLNAFALFGPVSMLYALMTLTARFTKGMTM